MGGNGKNNPYAWPAVSAVRKPLVRDTVLLAHSPHCSPGGVGLREVSAESLLLFPVAKRSVRRGGRDNCHKDFSPLPHNASLPLSLSLSPFFFLRSEFMTDRSTPCWF